MRGVILGCAVLAITAVAGCNQRAVDTEVLPVLRAYADNPADGDRQYQGKTLRMRIPGVEIDRNTETGETFARHSPGGTVPVRFMRFYFSSENEIAALKPGKVYTITGRCEGIGTGNVIVFRDCSAVETK